MKLIALQYNGGQFPIGYLESGRIYRFFEFGTNLQSLRRGGVGDQVDDDVVADERLTASRQLRLTEALASRLKAKHFGLRLALPNQLLETM